MTKNQIEYNKLLETRRANLANEDLTRNRDVATRDLGLSTLQETARHNQQVELQARDNLAEQYRNNVAQLAELQRSHLASEGLTSASISEAIRHDRESEAINRLSLDVSRLNAEIGAQSHVTSAGISAAASQYSSDNALLARQLEVDMQKYGIDVNAIMQSSQINETKRANLVREGETQRSNQANEGLKAQQNVETARHDYATEVLNSLKANADIHLRGEQNAIASQQARTQAKQVDANISLVPSTKVGNYAKAISSLGSAFNSVTQGINNLKGK